MVNMVKSAPVTHSMRPTQPQYRTGNHNIGPWADPIKTASALGQNRLTTLQIILSDLR